MEWLTETLLEMHFHRALVEKYKKRFGAKFCRFLKPSPQKEAWIGFDQAWIRSELSEQALFQELRSTISSEETKPSKFFIGEFLQYKCVQKINRKSSNLPLGFSVPYYRSYLSLKPNKTSGISQHETLCRLARMKETSVYYACAMVFDRDDLWKKPDLKSLRFVDITTAPQGWLTNEQHHIAFQNPTASPMWCSDPVEGRAFSEEERWQSENSPRRLNGIEVIDLIDSVIEVLTPEISELTSQNEREIQLELLPRRVRYLPTSMYLYEFSN